MTVDTTESASRDSAVFAMPSLGADMAEGRITEWLVKPGDDIERGQIVVIVETDKSDIEVEVFESAIVVELLVDEGALVPVGAPIARLATAGASGLDVAPVPAAARAPAPVHRSVEPVAARTHITSPVIRHLADSLHVDPRQIHGTGPGGRVHRDDVEAAANTTNRQRITPRARRLLSQRGLDPAIVSGRGYVSGDHVLALPPETATLATPAPSAQRPTKAETMRRHIAGLMARSWAEIPHFHVSKVLDLGSATNRLAAANESRSLNDRVVPGAVLLCAAARAAARVPSCNGWWRDGGVVQADDVRLGVVLSLRAGGIIVPTIERADELSPTEMMARLTELVRRARQGRLRASDLAEATITVTNLGDMGADSVAGVIHPPQVAIIGFGAVHDEAGAVGGTPTVRPVVHASLAGDHRAIDGLAGSRYLAQLQTLLDGSLSEEL